MKQVRLILIVYFITIPVILNAKTEIIPHHKTKYGLIISFINAGTGHGNGYTLNGYVREKRKALEIGIIYSEMERGIAGADINIRFYPNKFNFLENNYFPVISYLQYNILFQKSTSFAPQIIEFGGVKYEISGKPGKIATFGHYLVFGSQLWLFKQVNIDTSLGIGVYHGSLDQINGPGTIGIHWENFGITYSFKIGIGYLF